MIVFRMAGVQIGPRMFLANRAAIEVLEVLGFAWRGVGAAGEQLSAAEVVKRCDHYLKNEAAVQCALVKFEVRQRGSAAGAAKNVQAVLCDLGDLRAFAQKSIHAGREVHWLREGL
jgi:hypothetical protein